MFRDFKKIKSLDVSGMVAVKVKHRLAKKDIRPLLEEPEDPSAENEMAEAILLRLVMWYVLRLRIDVGCSCLYAMPLFRSTRHSTAKRTKHDVGGSDLKSWMMCFRS